MRILLSLFFILFIVSGCASKKRVVSEMKEYPSWYEKPLKSNASTLYAVAQGEDKRTAVNNALNEIIATLSVSLSSEFKSKTEVTKGDKESYLVTSSNEVYSEVQKIQINNYELLHTSDFGFEKYLVQVKVNKKKLFDGLKIEVDNRFQSIKVKDTKKLNALQKLSNYRVGLELLQGIQNSLRVMHSLDSSFDDSLYTQKITNLESSYAILLSNISFSVHSNKDAKKLKSSIAKGLSDSKYILNNSNGKNHFKVYISSKTIKAKSYGFDLARSAIIITTKDYNGNVVGSNKLNITGQSTQGYKIAKENVAIKLNALMKKNTISKILGVEL